MNIVSERFVAIIVLSLAVVQSGLTGANSLVMIIAPEYWYAIMPGLISTGPSNVYLLREIGLIELVVTGLYIGGTLFPFWRFPFWTGAAVWQTARVLRLSVNEATLFWSAFPYIFIPALVGVIVSTWAYKTCRPKALMKVMIDSDWMLEVPEPAKIGVRS